MDFPALGCYRQHSAPHWPNFSYAMYDRRAMEKKRDNLGSTWRPVQRLGGQLLTQFLTRSRRGWWVESSRSIDMGFKLRSPQNIFLFVDSELIWPAPLFRQHLRASRSRTTQTGTHSTCARPTLISQSGSQPGKVSWRECEKFKKTLLLRSSLAERNNIMLFLFLDQKAAEPHSCRNQEHGWFWYLKTVSFLKVFQLFKALI